MGSVLMWAFSHALNRAVREKYPTRSVEYLLAWVMMVWSVRVVWPGDMMVGPTYQYLIIIAPEWFWGLMGVVVAALRLFALLMNGSWRRSPMLRFTGAALGFNWWLALLVLYTAAVSGGAPDFPMRAVYPVFMFFEAYSCFRCGQDHATMKIGEAAKTRPASDAGHG